MAKKAKAKRRAKPATGSTGNPNRDDSATVPALYRESNAVPPEAVDMTNKGSVSRSVDLQLKVATAAKGLRVPFDVLGVPVNPSSITETSGNRGLMDAKRPPVVESDDLLLFFDPDLVPGEYTFRLTMTYDHEAEPVVPLPLENDKYAGIEETRKARRHR